MKIKFRLIFLFLFSVGAACPAFALNPQNWLKKMGQQRPRRTRQRQTQVAAVRGIDEPGQVDPDARNFDAIEKMEKRQIPAGRLDQFLADGNLKKGGKL